MCQEFTKRINHDINFENILIKDSNTKKESLKILNHLKSDNGFYIAMGEEDERITSKGLALLLKSRSEKITFIIGGPDGLSESVKEAADMTLSLSPLTFTHEMAKTLLLEQIYRAVSIINNRRYHKA
jgi:23S rRNA (pseudouridine1915-N3)-methyltransferase